jgi:hypothetical protein
MHLQSVTRVMRIACLLSCISAMAPAIALATGSGEFASPVQITFNSSSAPTSVRVNDVYSPRMIQQTINGTPTLVMYFGGWYQVTNSPSVTPNDQIYRMVCSSPTSCDAPQSVINLNNGTSSGFAMGSLANNPTIVGPVTENGQSIYIMYMTVVNGPPGTGFTLADNQIYYSTSFADDGVNWSVPTPLIATAWLPSATLDSNNPPNVILYANSTSSGLLLKYNLGQSGVSVGTPTTVNTGSVNYENVQVLYHSNTSPAGYQMLAQRPPSDPTTSLNSEIDYLFSTDGTNFSLSQSSIIEQGQTPGAFPTTDCWVYFGDTVGGLAGEQSNIFLQSFC